MKRLILVLALVSITFVLVGCGDGGRAEIIAQIEANRMQDHAIAETGQKELAEVRAKMNVKYHELSERLRLNYKACAKLTSAWKSRKDYDKCKEDKIVPSQEAESKYYKEIQATKKKIEQKYQKMRAELQEDTNKLYAMLKEI